MPAGTQFVDVILFGLGRMGQNHLRVIQESALFRLRGVVDPTVAGLRTELSGVPVFTDVEAVPVADYRAAVVATPTETHHGLAKALLGRGKHLLLEKPFASTPAECHELTRLAADAGVRIAVGHVERFNPVIREVAELLRRGTIGPPVHYTFTRAGPCPESGRAGKNVLVDLAVHDLDLLRMFAGEATLLSCVAHETAGEGAIDLAEMHLRTESGASASVRVNWLEPAKRRALRVIGTEGTLSADLLLQTCTLTRANPRRPAAPARPIDVDVQRKEPLRGQLEAFRALLSGEDTPLCLPPAATRSVELALQAVAMSRESKSRGASPSST